MRILGIERDKLGCNHYRIRQPLEKLRDHGLAEVIFIEDGPDLATDYTLKNLLEADVVVVHRPASKEWFDFIKLAQKHGKIIVCDYDDDPFNTSPWNPYYKYVGTQEYKYKWPDGTEEYLWKDGIFDFDIERNMMRRDMFRACFKKADLVTTTTPVLQKALKKINKNTIVLPNMMDFSLYPQCKYIKEEIRIGWQGGVSHYEDLHMIHRDIITLLQNHSNVKFVYLGDYRFIDLFKDAPPTQIEIHDWVPNVAYPYKLATLNLDIGLCPVVDNEFNRNKSAIKWMEYSMIGAATVASDCPPYSPLIKEGETAMLAKEDEWYDILEDLIEDHDKRAKLADESYKEVYEKHNIDKNIHMYKDAYEKLIKQEIKVK